MKIAAIIGSPHGTKGSTGLLLSEVVRSVEKAGAAVITLSLADYQVGPCQACDACHKTGKCPVRDELPRFLTAMHSADGVILASPNYIFSVSAQMKCLLDRCCGPLHCQLLRDKYAAAVVTSGGTGGEEVAAYLLRFLRSMGCWTVGAVAAVARELAVPAGRERHFAAAAELGQSLCRGIQTRAAFPDQARQRDEFFQRMKQLVTMRQKDWPFEYQHWQARGWL